MFCFVLLLIIVMFTSNQCFHMSLSHNTRRELPDGLFPTEPLFLAAPGATAEDDGLVLMSGPDGGNQVELSTNIREVSQCPRV